MIALTIGSICCLGQPIIAKHFGHFFFFHFRQFDGLSVFAIEFGGVVLRVCFRGEIAAQAHGDRSRCNFRKARRDDDSCAFREAATALGSPAASAKGTVRPSDIPMTMSRTAAVAVKCFSTCSVDGIFAPLRSSKKPA